MILCEQKRNYIYAFLTVSLENLSEGEQQLLTVIGLLRFTKDNDTLFLLDEPDTHLNPQWSYEYKEMLEEAIQDCNNSNK